MNSTLLQVPPPANAGHAPEAAAATVAPASRRRMGTGWTVGIFWLLALGCIVFAAANRQTEILAANRLENALRHRETGGADGLCERFARVQPPAQLDPDAYCWVNLTQRQWQQGTWRPHDFPFDNTPFGRERHWSSSLSWWLLFTGALTHFSTGQPMEAAIAQGALWANPLLFVLFLGGLALLLWRRLDAWTTGILLVTLASGFEIQWDFSYGRSDHHGLHLIAFTGMILSALIAGLGWVKTDEGVTVTAPELSSRLLVRPAGMRHARFWLSVSGVCGGAGLWIGAAQQCFGVAALGFGAVLGGLLFAGPTATARFAPELWRRWARVGAATSLGFYLLEYFPSHLWMRLEVNHPLMSLAWLGAGEVMFAILQARQDWIGARANWKQPAWRVGLGLAAMSLLPLAIEFGPKSWWVLSDPITPWTLSTVAEFQPWLDFSYPLKAWQEVWNYTGALLLTLPLTVGLLAFRRHLPPWRRMAILVGLVVSAVFLGWTLRQVRWIGFLEDSLAVLAVLTAPCLPLPARLRRSSLPLVLLALTVPGWFGFVWMQSAESSTNPFGQARGSLAATMADCEVAWNLRLLSPGQATVRVMCPFADGTRLHYYNSAVQTAGSFYWENVEGCRTGINFFCDEGESEAKRIAKDHALDFVMVVCRPVFVMQMQIYRLGYVDPAKIPQSLAYRLFNPTQPQIPDWLETVPLVEAPVAVQEGYRLYRVRRDRL